MLATLYSLCKETNDADIAYNVWKKLYVTTEPPPSSLASPNQVKLHYISVAIY